MTDQPDPLATLRGLAAQFEQLAQDADDDVERDRYRNDQVRFAQRCTATAWRHAARLTRQTLNDLDNSRTTPNNPTTSKDTEACCGCGGGPIAYRNFEDNPFCAHCSECDCRLPDGSCTAAATENEPNSSTTSDLREQYAEAIGNAWATSAVIHGSSPRAREDITDAVLAVRDQELEQLKTQLAALAEIARGYCPHCGRGDAAPTADMYLEQVQRADNAEAGVNTPQPRRAYLKGPERIRVAADIKTRYESGATIDEIAEQTGRPASTVRDLLAFIDPTARFDEGGQACP